MTTSSIFETTFRRGLLLAALLATLTPSFASALTMSVSFRSSTYQVQSGDDYFSLLAEHQTGSVLGTASVLALEDITTSIYAPGNTTNYSVLMTVDLIAEQTSNYVFQMGVDWGRGGIVAVIDQDTNTVIAETLRTDDLWWAYNWSHPDVFTTSVNLTQGTSYRLAWIGFEGCCAGSSTVRFSTDGGTTYAPLDAMVAEPAVGSLAVASLVGLALLRRRD